MLSISEPRGKPVTRGAGLRAGERLEAQWADARATIDVVSMSAQPPPG